MRKILVLLIVIILMSGCSINREEFPKVKFLKGSENLRISPDDNAESIKELKDVFVMILNVTHNNKGEKWAVVEFTDGINPKYHGCIKLNRLSDRPNKPLYVCNKETITGVAIGDNIEKAIIQFGGTYDVYKTQSGLSYSFNKGYEYLTAQIDPMSYTVKAIVVKECGYKIKEGFGVGDNAIQVLDYYQTKYKMNMDHNKSNAIFELGDGYVIEFSYAPNELVQESVITGISLYNIHDEDWK